MINYLALLVAVGLSSVAAYFSILGLTAIFAASFWPVVVMGSMLEAAKVIATSWTYRNWKAAPAVIRYYLVASIIILMIITSMGTFGYLSKAHLEQAASVSDVSAKLGIYEEKIKAINENIDANRTLLKQFDQAVEQVMARTEDSKGAERAVAIRRSQQKERSRIMEEISTLQAEVGKLNVEKAPLVSQVKSIEKEVGPIKYIAELFVDRADDTFLEKTVRWVIIIIVTVFDPLAVLLLIAANNGLVRQKRINKMNNTRRYNIEQGIDKAAEMRHKKLQELTGKINRSKVTIDKNQIRKIT